MAAPLTNVSIFVSIFEPVWAVMLGLRLNLNAEHRFRAALLIGSESTTPRRDS
jgi:hypothetical protein